MYFLPLFIYIFSRPITSLRHVQQNEQMYFILDNNLSPCCECCILSFGLFPSIWILCADVSEHSVCSILRGGVRRKDSSCSHDLRILLVHTTYEDGTNSVLKRWYIKFRCRRITQKKEYNICTLNIIFLSLRYKYCTYTNKDMIYWNCFYWFYYVSYWSHNFWLMILT